MTDKEKLQMTVNKINEAIPLIRKWVGGGHSTFSKDLNEGANILSSALAALPEEQNEYLKVVFEKAKIATNQV
jgi:hypothetical protein